MDGEPVDGRRWSRAKPKLLVKLLALQPYHQLHREQLMEMLWPELGPEAAANNLNKAIHVARHALQPNLRIGSDSRFIITKDHQVMLRSSGETWVDVDRFENLASEALGSSDAARYEAALAVYEGDLLIEDLYETWSIARRERLRALRQNLLAQLAEVYENGGLYDASIARLTELLAADPSNEEAHRALMRLYALTGNRRQAIKQYGVCCDVLKAELDAEPDAGTVELYKQIESRQIESRRVGSGPVDRADQQSEQAIDSIAVLPLKNAGTDPELEYLSDGIAETIISSLSQVRRLRVMAWSTVSRYKEDAADPMQIARALGVRKVLTGRVLHVGDRLVIKTELVDATDGSQVWGRQYYRALEDIFAVETEISSEIAEKLLLRLTGVEKERLAKRHTDSTEAYQLYLKGRYYWNKRTAELIEKSIECFERAIEMDPNYALAYAGLSDSYTLLVIHEALSPEDGFSKAKAAAARALEIDPWLAEAHASLAHAMLHNWEWAESEKEFRLGLDLNPGYAPAHHWYSEYLAATGRFDESIAEIEHAHELDPLSLIINAHLSEAFYFSRRYEEAREGIKNTLDLDPNFGVARYILAKIYEQMQKYDAALREMRQARSLLADSAEGAWMIGYIYAVSGRMQEARRALNDLKLQAKQEYVSPTGIALIHAALGETDEAFRWLDKAYRARCGELFDLKVEPKFDSLRSDPRFDDLLRRVGLVE